VTVINGMVESVLHSLPFLIPHSEPQYDSIAFYLIYYEASCFSTNVIVFPERGKFLIFGILM